MTVAYVDTSCIVAVTFEEPGAEEVAAELRRYDVLISSNLLEAELQATLLREKVPTPSKDPLARIEWIFPQRRLTREIEQISEIGTLKGADLWHVACALFLAGEPQNVTFASLDVRQREVAERLGFRLMKLPRTR